MGKETISISLLKELIEKINSDRGLASKSAYVGFILEKFFAEEGSYEN